MKSPEWSSIQPIAGNAVMETNAAEIRDPWQAFADLMAVVEEFCPEWPERETFSDSDIFLL